MTPSINWPQVGELAQTIGERAPQPSNGLNGKSFDLAFDDGSKATARFLADGKIDWDGQTAPCRTVELRPGLFMADFIDPSHVPATRTLIIDLARHTTLDLLAIMPAAGEVEQPLFKRAQQGRSLTAVTLRQRRAGPAPCFPLTAELVGKSKSYRYSATDTYQHIYISAERYSWQCLSGTEKGLADTDETIHIRLADGLILFIWLEKIIPTCGMVAIDFAAGQSSGKIFGYSSANLSQLTNVPVGASIIEAPIGLQA